MCFIRFLEPRAQKSRVLEPGAQNTYSMFYIVLGPGTPSQSESMVDALCGVKASLMQNL